MAITFVGSDSDQAGKNQNDLTCAVTHQVDDFGLVYGRADEQSSVPVLSMSAGWTLLDNQNPTSGRDRVEYVWYRKFTSNGTSVNTMSTNVSEEHSMSMHIFRGVDTTTPFDASFIFNSGSNNTTPTNSAITTVTDAATVILLHGATHDDITVAGAPTGYTLGEAVVGSTMDFRIQITAYDLDAGTAGTKTPTAWTHTSSPTSTAEWSVYTLALRPASVTGDQTVNFNFLDQSAVFNPAATTGSVTVGLNALAQTQLFDPTVTATVSVALNALSQTQLFDPTVTVGSVTVALNALSPSQVFDPTVTTGSVTVALNALAQTQLFDPTVTPVQSVALNALAQSQVFDPTVTVGSVTADFNALAQTSLFEPTVTTGGVSQTANLNTLAQTQLFDPTVTVGSVTVASNFLQQTQLFEPSVPPDSATVVPNFLQQTQIFQGNTVNQLSEVFMNHLSGSQVLTPGASRAGGPGGGSSRRSHGHAHATRSLYLDLL